MTTGPVAALPAGQPRDVLVGEVARALVDVPREAAVVVGCSGGPDSTALAFLVAEARPDLSMTLVYVAHGLRADDVESRERRLVAQHAAWLGVGWQAERVQVDAAGAGPEAAARTARYGALERVAAAVGAEVLLLGHTADDQAETVLLRLARGTGLDGLAGMHRRMAGRYRPLLRLRRRDVHAFVVGEGLPVLHDASNDDPGLRRNLVRHELLPTLERVGPDPVGALTRLAAHAARDAAALQAAAASSVPLHAFGPVIVLQRPALRRAHPALALRRVRDALTRCTGTPPSSAVAERVLAQEPGTRLTLPGAVRLEVSRAVLAFAPADQPTALPRLIAVPGHTPWPEAGVLLEVRTPASEGRSSGRQEQLALGLPEPWSPSPVAPERFAVPTGARRDRLTVLLPAVSEALHLRPVRSGDRVRTTAGTRRVSAVLRDAHVPRVLRARWPVLTVTDAVGGQRVLWVPGFAVDATIAAEGRGDPQLALALVRAEPPTGAAAQ